MALSPFLFRKPARDGGSQGLMALRAFIDVGAGGKPLAPARIIGIGTLPAGAFVTAALAGVAVAVAGTATPTVDVGIRDALGNATAGGLVAAGDVSATGLITGAGTKLGYQDVEQEVTLTLNGTGAPTAGRINVLVTYYAAKD